MKTVFSNSQCAHVWAQQTQSSGRSDSTFFEGDTIYSYGHHYKTAKIHTVKGKRVALVNSHGYSMTTQKHRNHAVNALSGLMPYFYASDVTCLKTAAKEATAKAESELENAFRKVKVTGSHQFKCQLDWITECYQTANQLRKLVGLKPVSAPKKRVAELKAHFSARLKRYQELNTPEMIAKRNAGAEKRRAERDAAKARKKIREQAEQIDKFREGKSHYVNGLPFEILRISGDTVQTSRGANVPLREALTLFKAVERSKDVKGLTVGSFTVIGVTEHLNENFQDDKVVQIGCHRVLLSEARAILGSLAISNLKLVTA